jgi:hypothetical protein
VTITALSFINFLMVFNAQYFNYIVAVSFIGGGNRRKPAICRKSQTNFIINFLMVFNATFNNISGISLPSVLLVRETGGRGENIRPVTSH